MSDIRIHIMYEYIIISSARRGPGEVDHARDGYNGCRGRGRPRKRRLDEIREITGINLQKLVTATGTGNNGGDWSMSSPEVVHDLTVQGIKVI